MAATASSISWHPAFVQAIKLELEPYRDALEFIPEYQLTSEPLEIDVVIIKKAPDLVIEKNIARIFRKINLLEYKSPDDYFSVHDFYKVLGYAFLYAALNKTPHRRPDPERHRSPASPETVSVSGGATAGWNNRNRSGDLPDYGISIGDPGDREPETAV
jgi:hypothetical protein